MIPTRRWPLTSRLKFTGFWTCFCVRPLTIFLFDIGLPYLAYVSITMRGCVAYIHDPDSPWPLTKFKFIGFCHVFPITSVCFDISIPYLAHESINMRGCVAFNHDPDRTLTFDLKVKFRAYRVYDMVLCSGHSFLSLTFSYYVWHVSVSYGTTCSRHLWPLTLTSISNFHHEFKSGKIIFALWHMHTKVWHIGNYHETTCCVHSWPLYDLDICPICGWWGGGVSLESFTHSFYLVSLNKNKRYTD